MPSQLLGVENSNSKYRERRADVDKEGDIQHEGPVAGSQRCGRHRLDLAWMSEATSSVYATPLITDLHADGRCGCMFARIDQIQELGPADPNAADPEGLLSDHYRHMYMGDYVPGEGGKAMADSAADASHFNGLGAGWADEDFAQLTLPLWPRAAPPRSRTHKSAHPDAAGGYVYVDPHIMTTPAIADIDGDGHDELVVATSYFYDREYYDDPEHAKDLKGIDMGKYVASSIAVFDLRTRTEKWVQHLDLSTDSTTYKAYAYSSPTLVDLNGDGKLEVVVGTSMGFLYVLDHTGSPLPGWPVQMGEIQGQPLVADINNDGELEIFASAMVRLELVDSSGLAYSDEFALSFHMHFHRLLKWAVALPLGLMLAVLLAAGGGGGAGQ
ncbi:hypothetical protein TSOC_000387 [Tetrabaena socialis]|uniref:Uncharacterized protein n=1 Tax=Tetrabaena socialis TaxID=47790 RepID=A0A2J8AJJ7_9CHLO|nr:hypothetical protein TSOC_000387 [Tetrabaena socialis]|eukprot:PNH12688.1 hypothetical protein TSOC_000387 [Tetrabaena socialis]